MVKIYFSLIFSAILSSLVLQTLSAQVSYPDNIISGSGECVVPFEPIVFDVKRKWNSPAATAHANSGPLVGDLDGDGIPEIITFSFDYTKLYVLNGSNGQIKAQLTIPSCYGYGGWLPVMTAVLVDSDRNKRGEIILATNDGKLTSYEAQVSGGTFSLAQKWQNTFATPSNNGGDNKPQPIVTDFNGDGIPEVVVFNQIYNAQTGHLLGRTEANIESAYVGRIKGRGGNNATNFLAVGDFDGDGLPEIAAGGKIYKITISADKLSCTSTILRQTTAFADGFTAVADVDLDGKLDVVVVDVSGGLTRLNVWSPMTGSATAGTLIHQFTIPSSDGYQGYPFIGDIDGVVQNGKRYPEICVTTRRTSPTPLKGRVSAYKYNPSTKKYVLKWELINTDTSGGTGITLFDFNNDGINELVYRDESKVYIYNGVADSTPVLASPNASFTCTSGTAFEYPVIADLDGSGSAQICVTCANNGTGVNNTLNAFTSGNSPWAPTRKVWNQVNYDPVLINDDLTVPQRLFPKQTAFTIGGQEYRPYNGALVQVPIMNLQMQPVVQAADVYVKEIKATFTDEDKKVVRISVVVGNSGKMNASAALPVTLYSIVGQTIEKDTKPIGVTLKPGDVVTIDFIEIGVENLAESYRARVQDSGTQYPAAGYLDCDNGNDDLLSGNVFANDDRLIAFMDKTNDLKVTLNDVIPTTSCTNPVITITANPTKGVINSINGKVIKYTPNPTTKVTNDTFEYQITCGGSTSKAKVYLTIVTQPDNISDATCYLNPESKEFTISELGSYGQGKVHSMSTPLVANLTGEGPEILAPKPKNASDAGSQWGWCSGFVIVNVKKNTVREINTVNFASHGQPVAIADVDGDGKCEIFIQSAEDSKIYCYNPDGTPKAGFTTTIVTNEHYIIQLADLNADGNAELIAGPYIFNAKTGQLLLNIGYQTGGTAYGSPHALGKPHQNLAYGGHYYMPAIGDVDGDGYLEIVAGGIVYKPKPDFSGCETPVKVNTATSPAGFNKWIDGPTVLVDFDKDGQLDVCVVGYQSLVGNSPVQFYVWNPRTKEVIAHAPAITGAGSVTIPYVGDLDGNGYPDFAFAGSGRPMISYQYDPTHKASGNIIVGPSVDAFAETAGFTMFDFNQDGKADIVYRGYSQFFVANLNTAGTGYDYLTNPPMAMYSGTVAEYPIVADVDEDGQAEIILCRAPNPWNGTNLQGMVSVYKSGDANKPWAPARSVWNQWCYSGVFINDDMTVPRYPMNPGTVFPGEDGQLETADDTRPYNGFLMQQTSLSRDGVPLFLTPNASIPNNGADIKFDYNTETNILTISDLKIENSGDAVLQGPIKITIHKGTVPSTTNYVHTWNQSVPAGQTKTVDAFTVPNFSNFLPSSGINIRINDNGTGTNYQPVCDSCCVNNNSDDFVNLPLDALGWADSYRKCKDEKVTLTGSDELGTHATYEWRDAKGNVLGSGRILETAPRALQDSGRYVLRTEQVGANKKLSLSFTLPFLSVAPEVMYWKTNAGTSNWNDLNNWNDGSGNSYKAIPAGCTTVHIPTGAANYPSLHPNVTIRTIYGNPMAGTIVYHYGAETAYPHLLTYERAKVQYNFGYYNASGVEQNKEGSSAIKMKRGTWYPLAAPLKKMASGDFSFGGYPYSWQALSDLISGGNNQYTIDFNKNDGKNNVELSTTHNSIAVKVAPYMSGTSNVGYNNHQHLNGLQGILEIPYFENSVENLHHPAHTYDKFTGKSLFYYFNNKTLQLINNPVEQMQRGDEAYRFVFEKDDRTVEEKTINGVKVPCYVMKISDKSNSKQVLVGNPFMSTINMKNFFDANAGVLSNVGYYIYDNSGTGTWRNFAYTTGNGVNPLQAFVVVFQGNAKGQELLFPLEGDYALTGTATGKVPRRLPFLGSLSVSVENEEAMSGDYAELLPAQTRGDIAGDVRKLVSNEGSVIPEVFFINNNESTYNLIQLYNEEENEVGLGIRSGNSNESLTLKFSDATDFYQMTGKTPLLIDKVLNVQQDLTQVNTYTFTPAAQNTNAENVDRFAIRLGDKELLKGEDNVSVYYRNHLLTVEANAGIGSVKVYNLAGQLLFTYDAVSNDATYFSTTVNLLPDNYVVKVETADKKSVSRKISVAK